MPSPELFEPQLIAVADAEITKLGGSLQFFPVDRPECAGGTSILHVCLDGAVFPLSLDMCSSVERFHAWLGRELKVHRAKWERVRMNGHRCTQSGYEQLELNW